MAANVSESYLSWIDECTKDITCPEELDANIHIALAIKDYLKKNNLSQKQLAKMLNVTPQYVNKLLWAKELNLSISTAIRYGNIMGVRLIKV